jgi:RHS repeat-associated protein
MQYVGYYQHQASGLALTKYRAYDSNEGRWLSRDPIGYRGGANLYGYVYDDPIFWSDVMGLSPTMDVTPEVPGKYHHGVQISIQGCHCNNIKMAQVVDVGYGPELDNKQNPTPGSTYYESAISQMGGGKYGIRDNPGAWWPWGESGAGLPWPSPVDLYYGLIMNFETCAVCLDGGTPKIIGCRKWSLVCDSGGHCTIQGAGTGLKPQPPSSNFTKPFSDFKAP